jgi:hypothetical protein
MFVIQFQQMIVRLFEEDKNVIFFLQKIFEHNILANYLKLNLINDQNISKTSLRVSLNR